MESEVAFVPIYIANHSLPIAFALIDSEDYDRVMELTWTFGNKGYPCHFEKNTSISLHRFVLGARKGFLVDHINNDPLDARKANLRECTPSQNSKNQSKKKANKTGFKGVSWCNQKKRYRACIKTDYRQKHLGYFDCPRQAAQAYNDAAREHHKEFAHLNQNINHTGAEHAERNRQENS